MEKILAVVTQEEQFSKRLCDYVNRKNDLVLTAVPFQDMAACRRFSEKHPVEVLLADREIFDDPGSSGKNAYGLQSHAGRTIFLDDGSDSSLLAAAKEKGIQASIRKFQPADSLIRCIMENCQGIELRRTSAAVGRPVKIIGVYSPADRSMAQAFAIALSRMTGRNRQTLYLNLGEFSGLGKLTGQAFESGISDALYHMKQGSLTAERIHAMIYSYEGIDYIPPVRFADDRRAVSGEDYGSLISMILKSTAYETVVIEMQNFAGEASEVMDICDTVYIPLYRGKLSELQADEFCEYLELSHRDALIRKLLRVELPDISHAVSMGSYIDSLVYGPIGDKIRELGEV